MAKKKGKSKTTKSRSVSKAASTPKLKNSEVKSVDFEAPPSEVIATTYNSKNLPVLLKVCRLCENKSGPFLNIFDAEKVIAKKIGNLMPFTIAENDDLPHKICFRCSAKVEELYEFVQKCIKTQENLCEQIGKREQLPTKTKAFKLWEEKLNKSNMSNDDICNAVIKRAMEGIEDIPLNLPLDDEDTKAPDVKSSEEQKIKKTATKKEKKYVETEEEEEDESDLPVKKAKLDIPNVEQREVGKSTRSSRLNNVQPLVHLDTPKNPAKNSCNKPEPVKPVETTKDFTSNDFKLEQNNTATTDIRTEPQVDQKPQQKTPKFDIMDHISMIKVNGVGLLFQCKLCNRNFLKKEVVLSHGCAKNGVRHVAEDIVKSVAAVEPPRIPTVKYITTKKDTKPLETKPVEIIKESIPLEQQKRKIGPASKVKRQNEEVIPTVGMMVTPRVPTPTPPNNTPLPVQTNLLPSVQYPTISYMNGRYKLVPGQNNTFMLIDETQVTSEPSAHTPIPAANTTPSTPNVKVLETLIKDINKPRGMQEPKSMLMVTSRNSTSKNICSDIIDLDGPVAEQSAVGPPLHGNQQPYPVGLFQTAHPTAVKTPFMTPAMKKQSYTIVQTGHPSKLLISTKPQPPVEELPKKKPKKQKVEVKPSREPFSVTLEDAAPPKDSGFFSFINVDPLLQPSYVLPTDNIIQESQITTSTPAAQNSVDKDTNYSCNLCGEKFTREKKLLTHIQTHYTEMDKEDQMRNYITPKKKTRK